MAKWESRLARENRRASKLELRKAEVEKLSGEEIAVPRAIKYICIAVVTLILGMVSVSTICGVIKHQQEQSNITACERFATQAGVEADCGTGKIGTIKTDKADADK